MVAFQIPANIKPIHDKMTAWRRRRDALAAARRVERTVALEHPDDASARLAAMCERGDAFYTRGSEKGINLDLLIAIEIAHRVLESAQDARQRARAQNNLGNALRALGERESGTK